MIPILSFDRDPWEREKRLVTEWAPTRDRPGVMLCARCGAVITDVTARVTMHGAHYHRVSNPAGLAFEVGCYRDACGLRAIGEPTHDHTWFEGYAWQVVNCTHCQSHLGWRFVGGHIFYALILRQLREGT
jgi:hypothetical protein